MDILSRLQSEFGDAVWPRVAQETDAVDGVQPQAIAAPRDEEAAQALVHWCGRENVAFVPRGGGTKLHIGAPPTRCDLIISTEKLTQIFDHDEGNATVQAGAGISQIELSIKVGELSQCVPLHGPKHSTLGGTIAANYYVGSKLKYGAPRDVVTGLHAVLSDGRLIKAGSKVVKNVSGYDLNKLLIGSFGTLGLITAVTVRLWPEPAAEGIWRQEFTTLGDAEDQAWRLINGPFDPEIITLISGRDFYIVRASFAGGESTVERQFSLLPENIELYKGMRYPDAAKWCVRVQLPMANASQWVKLAKKDNADEIFWECPLGMVRAFFEDTPDILSLRNEAGKLGGFLVVEKAPIEMKTPELVWGKPRGDFALMKKLKQSFDAANVCAPGRFIGGL
jgi:glycolate oxidase FAD binding subunit